jgi:chromosome segregation ATPase
MKSIVPYMQEEIEIDSEIANLALLSLLGNLAQYTENQKLKKSLSEENRDEENKAPVQNNNELESTEKKIIQDHSEKIKELENNFENEKFEWVKENQRLFEDLENSKKKIKNLEQEVMNLNRELKEARTRINKFSQEQKNKNNQNQSTKRK